MKKERVIFPDAARKDMTEEELRKAPYFSDEKQWLYGYLQRVSIFAGNVLKEENKNTEPNANKVSDAQSLLLSTSLLHDALRSGDKIRIANQAIVVGLDVGRMHTEKFEDFAKSGVKSKNHSQEMHDERHDETRINKTKALTYFRNNKSRWTHKGIVNKNEAARYISEQMNIPCKTVRNWLASE